MQTIPTRKDEYKAARNYLRSFSELYDRVAGTGLIPPQALEIEQSVLGAMMIDKLAASRVIEIIKERSYEDSPFYREAHTAIYRAIINLYSINEPLDLRMVSERLRLEGTLEEVGGPAYLVELTSKIVTTANVEAHSRLILEKYILRETIRQCEETKLRAFLQEQDTFEIVDNHNAKMFDLSSVRFGKKAQSIKVLRHDAIENWKQIHNRDGMLSGVPAGLEDLDQLTTGWQKTDLIILAARPSQGKTALALSLARNAAFHPIKELRVPVAIFSLEMGDRSLTQRLLGAAAEINTQHARTGKLTGDDWQKIIIAGDRFETGGEDILIDETANITPMEIRAKCRRLIQQNKIGLVIVDYIQLMESGRDFGNNREREISYISRSLKMLAKELHIPVIALSQLNRSLEARHDKRPMLSDLRESGAIEQDADLVLFIYRPEVYGIEQYHDGKSTIGTAEIILAKQRSGPIGSAFVSYRGEYGRFDNLAQKEFDYSEDKTF